MPTGFQRRILSERAASLAARGVASDQALLPQHLVCIAGGRHVALPVAMVASIRPFHCHPVPLVRSRAAGTMLGLASIGRGLASVLELANLLSPDGASGKARPSGGKMLLLRSTELHVALRVDRVLGALALVAAAEPGLALLSGEPTDVSAPLVQLIEPASVQAAIAALDA